MARAAWATAIALAIAVGAPIARAEPKLQFIGEGSLGWTDNVSSSPTNPPPGVRAKEPGAFTMLGPGVALSFGTPRLYHRVFYGFTETIYFGAAGTTTGAHRLEYRGFYDLTPRLDMVVTGTLVQTSANVAGLLNTPGVSDVSSVVSGQSRFITGTVDELLGYDLSPGWRAWQGAGALGAAPIFGAVAPTTMEGNARAGAEYSWHGDALGFEGGARYTVIKNGVLPGGVRVGTERQLVGTGVLRWRHDLGQLFTTAAEAGAMRVERLSSGRGFWSPTGGASIAYVTEDGDAELSYAHRVTTIPLLGQSLLADDFRLRGGLPLMEHSKLLLGVSAEYQRGRLIDENAQLAAHVDAILFDVGLGWRITNELLAGPRYQFAKQISDAQLPPLPLSYVRNTIMLVARIDIPPDTEMPRSYRAPRRVDRSDEIRDIGQPTDERRP